MFTGIIEEVGTVKAVSYNGELCMLQILASKVCEDVKIGDSIAVNGVCLTLTKADKKILYFDVMQQTIKNSDMSNIKQSDKVNLERSLRVNGDISGHFVYGHIDGVRKILDIQNRPGQSFIEVELQDDDKKYVVDKGSIAVSGISLTIGEVKPQSIKLFLIPHTFSHTILQSKKKKDLVNIEFDMLAKFVHKQQGVSNNISMDMLRRAGF